jgi:hypothetical protein
MSTGQELPKVSTAASQVINTTTAAAAPPSPREKKATEAVTPSAPKGAAMTAVQPISLTDIELPSGCNFVNVNSKALIAVCPAAPDSIGDKLLLTAPSLAISLIALAISGITFKYNRGKDARARIQSIQDDFWIRKIVSPMSIEPFLKYIQELGSILPSASQTLNYVEQTWGDQAQKLGEFRLSFQILDVVDATLQAGVLAKLDELDDRITVYCGELMQFLDNKSTNVPSRNDCLQDCNALTIAIFKLIQASQSAVGKAK